MLKKEAKSVMVDPKKVLSDVTPEHSFWFFNGTIVRNIYELVKEIECLDDYGFMYHANPDHDDFARWISDALSDPELAEHLARAKTKQKYQKLLRRRIRELEKLSKQPSCDAKTQAQPATHLEKYKVASLFALCLLLLAYSILTQSTHTRELSVVQEQLLLLKERDLILQRLYVQSIAQLQNATQPKVIARESPQELDDFFTYKDDFSPSDRIQQEQIHIYDDKIVIELENASWARFQSTGSMLPTLDEYSNAIELIPSSPKNINVGDIISYKSPSSDEIIVHRVVELGFDSEGWYAITKGDNNKLNDPFKIRYEQVERVLVGIIY